ncbi:sphingosine kinase [Thalassiosira pseudonana CCMP1335]|uniref:Sphingosine kinase n=1 Tax=Thalassiosira pseudonana TaxID=35128 RepID=B8BTD3_THAPS|nr:sphingosine kinase [Thalassiosira pseudonana CCMP1335]EED95075.1 sphingosine kinase [Thalassiosira pseudonana CCMP1335]
MTKLNDGRWPIAAASRLRVRIHNTTQASKQPPSSTHQYGRLFYNGVEGTIELIPCISANDDDDVGAHPEVYDDSNAYIENESSYQSYLSKIKDANRTVLDSFHPHDVIGSHLSLEYNMHNPNTFHGMESYACAKLLVYSYPKSSNTKKKGGECIGKREARHKTYVADPRCCENFSDVRSIVQAIRSLASLEHNLPIRNANIASSNNNKPVKYLVILNPFSGGGGESSKTGARHIYETMLKPMLEQAGVEHDALVTRRGAIIAMGGDGILFEIMQGVHSRLDEKELMQKLKFGIVGCGTSNGLAKSLLHWSGEKYGPLESIFQICKGNTSPLDIASYQLANTTKTYTSFLTFSWGLIADCDLDSECLRWLGPIRSDIWAVYRGILCRKKYRARFSYLPPNTKSTVPKIEEYLPKEWVTIEDDFIVFWVCNVSHASYNMYNCPMAKMNDGLFHILIVRASCSRLQLLLMLLKLETGYHIGCKELEVIDCTAYRLEPLTHNSHNDLDGELIEAGPIQAHVLPGGAHFFSGEVGSD